MESTLLALRTRLRHTCKFAGIKTKHQMYSKLEPLKRAVEDMIWIRVGGSEVLVRGRKAF